jgi:hypothetical protein
VVLNGKGVRSYPNPHGPNPARRPELVHAGHFLGVFPLAAHQPAIVKNLRAEVFHKAVERLRLSSDQLPSEFNFGVAFQGQYRFSL